MTPTADVEERLTRHARVYKQNTETASDLHARIMAQTVVPQPQRRSLSREFALAAAMLVFLGLLAFGISRMKDLGGNAPAKKSPAPQSRVIPWIAAPPTSTPRPEPSTVTAAPSGVAAIVVQKVTGVSPALVPSLVPQGMTAKVSANADSFDIQYTSARGDRSLQLSVGVPNPPPPGPYGTQSSRRFRGTEAFYQVDDSRAPTSHRLLMWTEPGISSGDFQADSGVPYLLSSSGLTDAAFWQVANSLRPVSTPNACTSADLSLVSSGINPLGGASIETLYIFNHNSSTCILTQPTSIELVAQSGTALTVPISTDQSRRQTQLLLPPTLGPSAGQLFVTLTGQACTGPNSAALRTVRLLGLQLTEPGRLCLGSSPPTVASGPLAVLGPTMKLGPSALSAALRAPQTVPAGHQLKYEVTITNISDRPVLFDGCPTYLEQIGSDGPRGHFRLNCQPAGVLAPGSITTFAMVLDIPTGTAPGQNLLSWRLDPPYSDVDIGAAITITKS